MPETAGRSTLELIAALSEAQATPLTPDMRFITSVLRALADREEVSVHTLSRGALLNRVEALANLRHLVDSGLVDHATGPMPEMLTLSAAGIRFVEGLGMEAPRRNSRGPAPRPAADPHAAVSVMSFAGRLARVEAVGGAADEARVSRVLGALLAYSDQQFHSLCKRTGLGMLDIGPVLHGLRAAGLVDVVDSASDARARLTADGRQLARAWPALTGGGRAVA